MKSLPRSLLLALAVSASATAGPLAYTCEVLRVYDLSEKGTLKASGFEKFLKGSLFSVSRVTGEIIGATVPTLLAKSTRVVNKGSTENSFKSVANFEVNIQILQVQEFRDGSVKPFVVSSTSGADIFTGTCK